MTQYFDLKPLPEQNQKSFYGKAQVRINDDGTQDLYSYDTLVARKSPDGRITRIWNEWSVTTGKHIKAFCGLNKREWDTLSV